MVRRVGVVFVLAGIAPQLLMAQLLSRVTGIASSTTPPNPPISATPIGAIGNRVLFKGSLNGAPTLWSTDGTSYGTQPLFDSVVDGEVDTIFVGADARYAYLSVGVNPAFGTGALWRTDGTPAGTQPVLTAAGDTLVVPGTGNGSPAAATLFNKILYLWGCAGADDQCGLWSTDGTSAGTHFLYPTEGAPQFSLFKGVLYVAASSNLLAIRAGNASPTLFFGAANNGFVTGLAASTDHLFFVAPSLGGVQVWASNGTTAGTSAVTSLPAVGRILTNAFAFAGNRAFFVADDVTHGQEVWSSDGTAAGTRRETDFPFAEPFGSYPPTVLVPAGSKVVFFATDGLNDVQLWGTSGTGGAPVLLASLCTDDCQVTQPRAAGSHALFAGTDINHGNEIWTTDGTPAGTQVLVDICPGACSPQLSDLYASGGKVVFWALGDQGVDLWQSDGTRASTKRLLEGDDPGFTYTGSFVSANGRLYFPFSTASSPEIQTLWSSDGTSAAPVIAFTSYSSSVSPSGITALGSHVLFAAQNGLWSTTAGTTSGVQLVPNYLCTQNPCPPLATTGALAFFFASSGDFGAPDLWATDGTPAETRQLTSGLSISSGIVPFSNEVAFIRSNESLDDQELWISDGTVPGTRSLSLPFATKNLGLAGSANGKLYLTANPSDGSTEFIQSDGTTSGSKVLVSFTPESLRAVSSGSPFVAVGNSVYFVVSNFSQGTAELWQTDSTSAGTQLVTSFSQSAGPPSFAAFGGSLYFISTAFGSGDGLMRSTPGLAALTTVKVFDAQNEDQQETLPPQLTVWSDRLFFVEFSTSAGFELWTSDGTEAGTTMVRDIRPGPEDAMISGLVATPAGLFFAADEGLHGVELWRSDGTAAGTRLVEDLAPGLAWSSPTDLTVAGDDLYLAADDEIHGSQLWFLPLQASGCTRSGSRLCLGGGRFQVEVDWKDFAGNVGVGTAVTLSDDTGYFWFFNSANVEVVVKVLDGRGVNGEFWVFYGALSNVDYTLTVTDAVTGASRHYYNPSGHFGSLGDTTGFGPSGSTGTHPDGDEEAMPPLLGAILEANQPRSQSSGRLRLFGSRFAISVTWRDSQGHTGSGTGVMLTSDTGYFWFFDPANVELMIKVIDGTAVNGKIWVFYGALSDVEYQVTVTDTRTGHSRIYRNPLGNFASVGDTSAF